MDLLKKCGIAVPDYKVALSADEAFKIAQEFGEVFFLSLCLLYMVLCFVLHCNEMNEFLLFT